MALTFVKAGEVIKHDQIAHASGSSFLMARKAHELRSDMNSAMSTDTTLKRPDKMSCQRKNSEAAHSPSKDQKMTFPEWTKPGIYGALVGAIAITFTGFTLGGWKTTNSAQTMAKDLAAKEVTLAMVPVCLEISAGDPERIKKLAILKDLSGFRQRNALMETGWATLPGSEKPDRNLAEACLPGLALDGS